MYVLDSDTQEDETKSCPWRWRRQVTVEPLKWSPHPFISTPKNR